MKISSVNNYMNFRSNNTSNSMTNNPVLKKGDTFQKEQTDNAVSFKGVYIQFGTQVGPAYKKNFPPEFLPKDSLLLNEIAQRYPNQDCFICEGQKGYPCLEYRERPVDIPVFYKTFGETYKLDIDPSDKDYPTEPLLLYKDVKLSRFIGVTSYISLNPSLPFTIQTGYELHKKLIEKKYQIMETIGRYDEVDLGEESLIQRAHKEVEDIEIALTRYLMECSYSAIMDKASASQIYASNYPKVQSRLDAKRKMDLITSLANQPMLSPDDIRTKKVDICDEVMKAYPDIEENKARIEELCDFMTKNGIWLGRILSEEQKKGGRP